MVYLQDDPPLPPLDDIFPHLEKEPGTLSSCIDPFTVTTTTGFLPTRSPITELPTAFRSVSTILERMPILKQDGKPGLLADFQLGPFIDGGGLPDLSAKVEVLVSDCDSIDLGLVTALFRDYSFLASAYLLEPCWETWSKKHKAGYGLGRPMLPKCIAGPLIKTANV